MMSQAAVEAEQLLRSGHAQAAMDKLGPAAAQGDPDALLMLGELCLVGKVVHRDLPLSRDLFRRAASAGSRHAAAIYRAFVANGTGAPSDWPLAIDLLKAVAYIDPDAERDLSIITQMALTEEGDPVIAPEGELLSPRPEVRLFRNIFTEAECDFLVGASVPRMNPSQVIDPGTGQLVPNPVRTSEGASFPLAVESPAIHALCRRLAAASGTDVGQGEPLQVLCYSAGQEYKPHFDAIDGADNQRILTFLVYLNDDFEGGETEFLSSGLKVKGRKGDGLLFRNADEAGRPDLDSQHAGLPLLAGVKFLASRWIRQKPVLANHS